jgi:Domain of unknown function (DUF4258)
MRCREGIKLTKLKEYTNERHQIRTLVESEGFNLALTKHAREEMKNDDLDIMDIIHVLRGCYVIAVEPAYSDDCCKYIAEGKTADNRLVNIVLILKEDEYKTLIITVYEIKQ